MRIKSIRRQQSRRLRRRYPYAIGFDSVPRLMGYILQKSIDKVMGDYVEKIDREIMFGTGVDLPLGIIPMEIVRDTGEG